MESKTIWITIVVIIVVVLLAYFLYSWMRTSAINKLKELAFDKTTKTIKWIWDKVPSGANPLVNIYRYDTAEDFNKDVKNLVGKEFGTIEFELPEGPLPYGVYVEPVDSAMKGIKFQLPVVPAKKNLA